MSTRVFINGCPCEGANIDLRLNNHSRAVFEVSKSAWVQSDLPDPYRMPVAEPLEVVVEQDTPPPTDPALRKVRLVGWESFKTLLRQMRDIFLWQWRTTNDPDYATRTGIAQVHFGMVMTTIEYEHGSAHLHVNAVDYTRFIESRLITN